MVHPRWGWADNSETRCSRDGLGNQPQVRAVFRVLRRRDKEVLVSLFPPWRWLEVIRKQGGLVSLCLIYLLLGKAFCSSEVCCEVCSTSDIRFLQIGTAEVCFF